jgi:hypothetical protein
MNRLSRLVAATALTLTLTSAVVAQEEPEHPLMQMLALVPDIPAALENVPAISYVDFAALETARPGVGDFSTGAEFNAARDAREASAGIWMANMQRIIAAPPGLAQATLAADNSRDLVGFDLFDVDQALTFGVPPSVANILLGDFDNGAIVAAYEARDYAVTQNEGVVILQRADGEPGYTQSLAESNRAIPFGGELGRREPLVVLDGLLLNSADDAVVQALVATATGEQRSLTARPSMVAAAEALTSNEATLLQAAFLDPRHVAVTPMNFGAIFEAMESQPTVEELEAMLEPQTVEGYGALPFYTMAVMADMQIGSDQVATLALVYDDEAEAEAAAAELTNRLAIFRDTVMRRDEQPLIEMVEGARVGEPEVFAASNGKYVALASVLYPQPDNTLVDMLTGEPVAEDHEGPANYLASGRVIRYWIGAVYARAFDVLYVTD